MTALRLIIQNHPSWQKQPEVVQQASPPDHLPAPSHMIFTILGRRNNQWHTIVPRIDNADDAVTAMDSANRSTLFDRLVIATATSVGHQPAGRWETFACSLPLTALAPLPKRSFEDLLDRAERRQAAQATTPAFPHLITAPATSVIIAKRDASLWLLILLGVGVWSQAWPVLIGVAAICLLETCYMAGLFDRMIPATQRPLVQTGRFYLYSLCAGLIAIPLLAGVLLNMMAFLGV